MVSRNAWLYAWVCVCVYGWCVCAHELTLQLVPLKVSKEEKSKVVITMEDGSAQMSLDQVQHSE